MLCVGIVLGIASVLSSEGQYSMRMKSILVATSAAFVLTAGAALAAPVPIPGTIGSGDGNDGVVPIYGADPVSGLFGADWALIGGPADITVSFLGREAGFGNNSFNFGGGAVEFTNRDFGQNAWNASGFDSVVFNSVASGVLTFEFWTRNGVAANGSNPDNSDSTLVNYFSVLSADAKVLELWLDDADQSDDNHDDMAIRLAITGDGTFGVVPLPAAGWLLIAGLGGLAAMKRRKKA